MRKDKIKNKRKNIKKIIFILIILFIILLILLVLLKRKEKAPTAEFDGSKFERTETIYLQDKIIPQGTYELTTNYKGNVVKDTFYNALKNTVNYFGKVCEEVQYGNDYEKIFSENKEQIKEYLGIEKLEDFKKVCEVFKEKSIQHTAYSYCKIVENTFEVEGIYTKFDMIFYYEDGTEIEFQIGLLNKEASKTYVLTVFAK